MTLTGNFNSPGTNTVSLIALDNNGFYATNSFTLGFAFVDHPPTISVILNQATPQGVPVGPLTFTVNDVGGLDQGSLDSLTVSAYTDSVSQKVLPTSNILLQKLSSTTYTLTLFPIAQGIANVLVTVSDGTKTTTNTFSVLVEQPAMVLASNLGGMTVAAGGLGAPYPDLINFSGLLGKVSGVQVTLFDIGYVNPSHLNVLLVSPDANYAPVLIMGHAGGSSPMANTTLILADTATTTLPGSGPVISGAYKPINYGSQATFPGSSTNNPKPGPYTSTLGSLIGSNPNGNWSLFVYDDGSAQGGFISGGWQLAVQTSPDVLGVPGTPSTPENTTGDVTVTVGDNETDPSIVVTTGVLTNASLIANITGQNGTGATRTLAITPTRGNTARPSFRSMPTTDWYRQAPRSSSPSIKSYTRPSLPAWQQASTRRRPRPSRPLSRSGVRRTTATSRSPRILRTQPSFPIPISRCLAPPSSPPDPAAAAPALPTALRSPSSPPGSLPETSRWT